MISQACGGLWDEGLCAFCSPNSNAGKKIGKGKTRSQQWEAIAKLRDEIHEIYPNDDFTWREREVSKESKFKTMANAAGMLEPFLILVTMVPEERNLIANSLGWTNITEDHYSVQNKYYTHEESWLIINKNLKGIQARINTTKEKLAFFIGNPTWYEVLVRTCSHNFKTCMAPKLFRSEELHICRQANHPRLVKLKQEWLEKLWFYKIQREPSDTVKQICEHMEGYSPFEYAYVYEKEIKRKVHELKTADLRAEIERKVAEMIPGTTNEPLLKGTSTNEGDSTKLREFVAQGVVSKVASQVTGAAINTLLAVDNASLLGLQGESAVAAFCRNAFTPSASLQNVIVDAISRAIARAVISAQGEAAIYSVAELATLIATVAVPVIDAFFALVLVYSLLSMVIGSSPERLVFAVERILFQELFLKENNFPFLK